VVEGAVVGEPHGGHAGTVPEPPAVCQPDASAAAGYGVAASSLDRRRARSSAATPACRR
jgi:hypothetical protein